jgi:HlyD family secretion protein
MKKLISLLVVLASVPIGFCAEGAGDQPRSTFRTAAVTRGPIEASIRATGTLEPEEVVDVGAQVAGQILKFGQNIDYGTQVDEGTVLAQIDPSIYQAQVEQARASLKRAEAELHAASALLQQAERDLERAKRLAEKAIGPAELAACQAKYEVAKANVAVSQAAVLQSEAALKLAEINLSYCTIRSPIKGVIIDRRVNVGQTVVASLTAPSLFLIAKDLKRLQVWASVNEVHIGQIKKGQAARFTTQAFPKQVFRGEVTQIRLNATMTKNVVTYTVVIAVDNADGKLLPYLTADVQFLVARRQNALLVPSAALRWRPQLAQVAPEHRKAYERALLDARDHGEPERDFVWVEEKGFVRPIAVRTGLTDGTKTEIVDGDLEEGKEVVTGVR